MDYRRYRPIEKLASFLVLIVLSVGIITPARAQNEHRIQIKSFEHMHEVEDYIRSSSLPLVAFSSSTGWYAITLQGKYSAQGVQETLRSLKQRNLIPADSYANSGRSYIRQVCCDEADASSRSSPVAASNSSTINWGNNSSQWANDGECDDPRFEGRGMASPLEEADRMRDANDCRKLFEQGAIRLRGAIPPSATARGGGSMGSQSVPEKCELTTFSENAARICVGHFLAPLSTSYDIAIRLVHNGNWSWSRSQVGESCVINLKVEGVDRGSSYNYSGRCRIEQPSRFEACTKQATTFLDAGICAIRHVEKLR